MISNHQRTKVLFILLFGTFLTALNQTVMTVALPTIMKDFHITAGQGQWLSNGYMLVNGIMIPATAFLIERFKTRHLYMFAMIVFTAGTVVAGIAPNYTFLIAGRMIQAIGAGIIAPLLTVVVLNLFPPNRRGIAMGYIGLAMNFAPAIAPTLSGWIVQQYNWRYLFYIVFPLAIINLIAAYFILQNVGKQTFPKFNVLGIILSTVGLGSLLLGFSNAGDTSWMSFNVFGYILIGTIVTALFIFQQLRSNTPLLNFSVFKFHSFSLAVIINFFVMMGLYGGMLLLPIFLQNIKGISPLISGLVMLPGALLMAVLSPIVGGLFDRIGAKILSCTGLIVVAFGTFLFSLVDANTSVLYVCLVQTLRSVGLAFVMMPLQTEALNVLPLKLAAHGSAMYNTIRQIAGSIGTAVLITVMSRTAISYSHAPVATATGTVHGIKIAYLVSAILLLIGAFLTLRLKKVKETVIAESN